MKKVFVIAQVLFGFALFSQEASSNQRLFEVVDARDGFPLTFVSVSKKPAKTVCGWTNFDGKVTLVDILVGEEVIFTHVGYEPETLIVVGKDKEEIVKMHRSALLLAEFEVRAQKDRARLLMQKVIDNFSRNNPLKNKDFSCEMYNKMKVDFMARDSINSDSTNARINKTTAGGHLMLLESVVQYSHHHSGISEEKVLASKVSGFDEPEFALLASDFQPFGFYDQRLELFDMAYLNPVSQIGLSRYKYQVLDTLLDGSDTVFIVAFQPSSFGYDRLLSGKLYIHSGDYALQNVTATPAQSGLVDFKLEQVFGRIGGHGWFPKELNFEILFKEYPSEKVVASSSSRSTVRHVTFEPLKRSDLDVLNVNLSSDVFKRDSVYWASKRSLPLNEREAITYTNMDSIADKLHFSYLTRLLQSLSILHIPFGFLDVSMSQTFKVNRFENIRIGTGVYTNSSVSKYFRLGGHFGYGLNDNEWKYGMLLRVFPHFDILSRVEIKYNNDIREAGGFDFPFMLHEQFEFRDLLVSRMERHIGWNVAFHSTRMRYADISIGAVSEQIFPLFNYEFVRADGSETHFFNYAVDIQVDYNFKSKLYEIGGNLFRAMSNYPQIRLVYRRGFSANSKGFDYDRLFIEAKGSAYLFGTLKSSLTLQGGFINEVVPVGFLFGSFGARVERGLIFIPNYFQTMLLNTYVADRYAALFLKQELLNRTFKLKFSSPKIALWHAMGVGYLTNPLAHQKIEIRTMDNGYVESGLLVNEVLKYKYSNIFFANLGAGVFYGYGFNANHSTQGQPLFRLLFSASVR